MKQAHINEDGDTFIADVRGGQHLEIVSTSLETGDRKVTQAYKIDDAEFNDLKGKKLTKQKRDKLLNDILKRDKVKPNKLHQIRGDKK